MSTLRNLLDQQTAEYMAHENVIFPSKVLVTCKQTVISTKPVQAGKFIPLSVLDRIMEGKRIEIVLYYETPKGRETGVCVKKLRESLSQVLSSFPIMTGRLMKNTEGHWMIKCNDAGVRLVEAKVKGNIDDWLRNSDKEKELKLVYREDLSHKPYFTSTFCFQITEFEEGGLAIGLSCSHLLADPICATMFIRAWADTTSLGGKMMSPPFFHPLPSRRPFNTDVNHKPYTDLINHYKSSLAETITSNLASSDLSTVILSFTHEMVESCMRMAGSSTTPFEALAALFLICLSKVKAKNGKGVLPNMVLCLDMRKVLGLDKGYFGNCMVYNKVNVTEISPKENHLDHLLPDIAIAIREVTKKMDHDGIMDLIEWLETDDKTETAHTMTNRDQLVFTNLEGVDLHGEMFMNGFKLIHASYYVEPMEGEGQVLVLPSAEGDGSFSRVVMVTLPREEVIKLLENEFILSFSPTVIMNLSKRLRIVLDH